MSSVVTQLITELRQTADGASVLNDWLGDGALPVDAQLANNRANICRNCPFHVEPNWWHRVFKDPVARAIRKHIEVKNKVGLSVLFEEFMAMCSRCGCATRLKVWTPIEHIKAHHKPEHNYPAECWVKKEMETL